MSAERAGAVLIDTDIGDDVDDAFALALALRLPTLHLRGVTTVCGPSAERARLARLVAAAAGAPALPVAAGAERRADGRLLPAKFSHRPLLRDAPPLPPAPAAVELIHDCARAAPLTILALGPLTNIAAALERDPALAARARLVAVAGVGGLPYPDWNLRSDPQAARRVLASGMPVTLVGLQLTWRRKLWPAQLRRLLGADDALSRLLAGCVLAWRTPKRRMPILHDALAVAVAADPALARVAPRRVAVLPGGVAPFARGGRPNADVCVAVDEARYTALLEDALLGGAVAAGRPGWRERLVRQLA